MLIYNTTFQVDDAVHDNFLIWIKESSGLLHRWHMEQGVRLNDELKKIFKDKVVGFPTLMEIVE